MLSNTQTKFQNPKETAQSQSLLRTFKNQLARTKHTTNLAPPILLYQLEPCLTKKFIQSVESSKEIREE